MSNKEEEQYYRLKSYKEHFNKKMFNCIEQYNKQSIDLFKLIIKKNIIKFKKEHKKIQITNISDSDSDSGLSSDTNELSFEEFFNKKFGDEIDNIVSKQNNKYEREFKNTLDNELTTFLNKTLFMIFDIKRQQEQTTEMMISNLINRSVSVNEDDEDDEEDEDEEESSIKRFLERFNLNSSDNEDMENLDEIDTNCINSDIGEEVEEDTDDDVEEEVDDVDVDVEEEVDDVDVDVDVDVEEETDDEEEDKIEKNTHNEEEEEDKIEKEQKQFLNEKNLTDLKAIAKTLDIPLKYGGKHKSKSTIINEIFEKEKEELKKLNKQND